MVRVLLPLLVLSSSSISFAQFENMTCDFSWSELTTELRAVAADEFRSQTNSPRDSRPGSPRTESPRLSLSAPSETVHAAAAHFDNNIGSASPRLRRAKLQIETTEASGRTLIHRIEQQTFAMDGKKKHADFNLITGCTARFKTKGFIKSKPRGKAQIKISCGASDQLDSFSKKFSFGMEPDHPGTETFVFIPKRNAAVSKSWDSAEKVGTRNEVREFRADCKFESLAF